jgi:hypothetical protein
MTIQNGLSTNSLQIREARALKNKTGRFLKEMRAARWHRLSMPIRTPAARRPARPHDRRAVFGRYKPKSGYRHLHLFAVYNFGNEPFGLVVARRVNVF